MRKKLIKNKVGIRKYHKYKHNAFTPNPEFFQYIILYSNKIIKFIILICLSKIITKIISFNNINHKTNIFSEKWLIMTAFNPPTETIIQIEQKIENWKILIIGNNNTNDTKWDIFHNSTKLIYLSINAQNKLGYNILRFLKNDSYCRKNIGYLLAIQHGAKEIYEIDENININQIDLSFFDINVNNSYSYVSYGISNNQKMINPLCLF